MDLTRYRKYVCKSGKGWGYVSSTYRDMMEFKQLDEPWEQVCHRVPIGGFEKLPKKIFQLYQKGYTTKVEVVEYGGYTTWQKRRKICIGYRLKNNPSIFRPIFNQKLQLNINLFQKNIKQVVDKRMEKHVYIELFKIKQFPKVIVDKIFKMVY